jgi:hypothetical protein
MPSSPQDLTADDDGERDLAEEVMRRLSSHSGRFERDELKNEIARGGQGAVFKVWDTDLQRDLAMKIVVGQAPAPESGRAPTTDSKTLGRFLEEAQVTGQLDHPDIVPIHELGLDDEGRVDFTMKLVRGRELSEIFELVQKREEGWNLTRALELQSERQEKAGAPSCSPLMTMDGDVIGTPDYMPPEQAMGRLDLIGPASDVYSVGAMLYHLFTGQMPYALPGAKLNNDGILSRVQEEPPRSVACLAPELPAELVAICEKAMARQLSARYASKEELASDLQAYIEGRVVKAYGGGPFSEAKKWVKRNKALATQRANDRLRLSARQQLEDLVAEADELWPAVPEHIEAYEDWLVRARRLLAQLPNHGRMLEDLQAGARTTEDRWWHTQLTRPGSHEVTPWLPQRTTRTG